MSDYLHDRHKFADTGLQLRMPVDIIPANQYSQLTNALPVIEGQLVTREGVTFIAALYLTAAVSVLSQANPGDTTATIATTLYPHGFSSGNVITLVVTGNDPTGVNTVTLGTYTVTITNIDAMDFSFTPGIPTAWVLGTTANVFAQATNTIASTTFLNYGITNLFRLDESVPSIQSARLGAMQPGRLYVSALPPGNMFSELVLPSLAGEPPSIPSGYAPLPFSIVGFRFTDDPASWAIIANPNKMAKFRYDIGGVIRYFLLGNPIPITPATAVAGGSGNLNSVGGTPYDWRYTYYDGYVNTEGNPSDSPDSATITVVNSTLSTTPDPALNNYAGSFYTTSNVAFTSVTDVSGTGTAAQSPDSKTFDLASCRWFGFANPSFVPAVSTLVVNWQVTINNPQASTLPNEVSCVLSYSVNGGTTFTVFAHSSSTQGQQNATVVLPQGTDYTQVVVQCYGVVNSWFVTPPYSPGTNFTVLITNIEIDANPKPVPNTLDLTNQEAIVTVQLPGILNDGRVTGIRLYRRGGTLPDTWRLVGTYALSGLTSVPIVARAGQGVNGTSIPLDTVNWTNPNYVTQGVLYATATFAVESLTWQTQQNYSTLFGFSVGAASVVQGIVVTLGGFQTAALPGVFTVTLLKGGLPTGTSKTTTAVPTSPTTFSLGGASDLWGASLTGTDVDAAGFGVSIQFSNPPGGATTINLNNVNIGVFSGFVDITDNISDTQLSTQPVIQLDNDQPVTSISTLNQPLSFIWGPVGLEARMLGCGDPNRPECIYFSKPGNPDAWPPENFVEVSEPGTPILAGCVYNTYTYAFSRERVYQLVEGVVADVTFSPFVTPSAHGLFTPWGLAVGPAIYFVAKDGIYETTGGQESSIVENDIKPLFPTYDTPGQMVQEYDAVDMTQPNLIRLTYFNSELYFVYSGVFTGTLQLLIYDILKKRWRAAGISTYMAVPYAEPNTISSLLMGTLGGEIYQNGGNTDPHGSAISVVIQTGSHDQGLPLNQKQYGNVIFDIDPGGATVAAPVTITPFINGQIASEAALVITGAGRQQIPLDLSDYFAFNTEFSITWQGQSLGGGNVIDPVLYQYDILYFPEPVAVQHWEAQPTSFEFPGFLHMRDAYIAIRSTADVTLTLTIDVGFGTQIVQTYTVPNTGGLRLKQYIQFASNKGLLYQIALDCPQSFRLYVEDIEFRCKPWIGVMGYSIQRTVGGEGS